MDINLLFFRLVFSTPTKFEWWYLYIYPPGLGYWFDVQIGWVRVLVGEA